MQVSRKIPELHVNANTAKGPGLKNSRKSAGKIKGRSVEPVIGFYRRNSHDIVDCHDCKIQSMPAVAVADALRRYMKMYEAPGCGKNAEKGLIRNVTVRTAFGTGEVMVILTLAGSGVPHAEELTEMLADAVDACNLKAYGNSSATYGNSSATCDNSSATCGNSSATCDNSSATCGDFSATYGSASERCENCSEPRANLPADDSFDTLLPAEPFYSLQSIVLNMDTDKTSRKGGVEYLRNVSKKNTKEKRSKVLAGKSTINDELGGMRFEISPSSFYQVNPVQTEKLYNVPDLQTKRQPHTHGTQKNGHGLDQAVFQSVPGTEGAFGQKPQALQRGLTLHGQQRAARGQGQEQSQKKNKAGAPTQRLLPFDDAKHGHTAYCRK